MVHTLIRKYFERLLNYIVFRMCYMKEQIAQVIFFKYFNGRNHHWWYIGGILVKKIRIIYNNECQQLASHKLHILETYGRN